MLMSPFEFVGGIRHILIYGKVTVDNVLFTWQAKLWFRRQCILCRWYILTYNLNGGNIKVRVPFQRYYLLQKHYGRRGWVSARDLTPNIQSLHQYTVVQSIENKNSEIVFEWGFWFRRWKEGGNPPPCDPNHTTTLQHFH